MQKDAAQVKGNQKQNRIFGKGNQTLNRSSCAERSPKVEVNQKMKNKNVGGKLHVGRREPEAKQKFDASNSRPGRLG